MRVEKKKEAVPDLRKLLEVRDYTGAMTLIEFECKVIMDKKQASGWREAGAGNYQWGEGGNAQLTMDEARQDADRVMWLACAAFHLGNYQQALDAYQSLKDKGSEDPMLNVYMGCCLERLGWHTEAEEKAFQAPSCPLQNRLLFHLAHRLNDENKLMAHHQKLADTTLDQLSLASVHFLRNHFQEATDIYKRLLLENRDYTALNVYVALCCTPPPSKQRPVSLLTSRTCLSWIVSARLTLQTTNSTITTSRSKSSPRTCRRIRTRRSRST